MRGNPCVIAYWRRTLAGKDVTKSEKATIRSALCVTRGPLNLNVDHAITGIGRIVDIDALVYLLIPMLI